MVLTGVIFLYCRFRAVLCSLFICCLLSFRCVSIFPDQLGFAVGSIEGRVGIEYFSEQAGKQQQGSGFKPLGSTYTGTKQSFAFKCHRVTVSAVGVAVATAEGKGREGNGMEEQMALTRFLSCF